MGWELVEKKYPIVILWVIPVECGGVYEEGYSFTVVSTKYGSQLSPNHPGGDHPL